METKKPEEAQKRLARGLREAPFLDDFLAVLDLYAQEAHGWLLRTTDAALHNRAAGVLQTVYALGGLVRSAVRENGEAVNLPFPSTFGAVWTSMNGNVKADGTSQAETSGTAAATPL